MSLSSGRSRQRTCAAIGAVVHPPNFGVREDATALELAQLLEHPLQLLLHRFRHLRHVFVFLKKSLRSRIVCC
jgi:hypothetical protein